jgi:hypothetical protein
MRFDEWRHTNFRAEVERVLTMLEHSLDAPVLFPIDEILSGTMSRNWRIALTITAMMSVPLR